MLTPTVSPLGWVRFAAAIAAVAGLIALGWFTNGWRLGVEIERIHGAHAKAIAAADAKERAREKQWQDAKQEAEHVATMARTRADADRRAADVAHHSLLDAARSAAQRAGACPATEPTGPPAPSPADLLADVLGRVDQVAGELAEAVDQSRIAGLACERSYDAVAGQPQPPGPVTP